MATGEPPWSDFKSQYAAMFQIGQAKGPPPIPNGLLSPVAEDFIRKCCHPIPSKRHNVSRLLNHPFLNGVGIKFSIKSKPLKKITFSESGD